MSRHIALAAIISLALLLAAIFMPGDTTEPPTETALVIPELEGAAAEGAVIYADTCAACHGENGVGTEQGPAFIHRIYEPSHHSDMSFVMAVRNGVQAHHWQFGNMPAQEALSDDDIANVIAYVRALQRANGID